MGFIIAREESKNEGELFICGLGSLRLMREDFLAPNLLEDKLMN